MGVVLQKLSPFVEFWWQYNGNSAEIIVTFSSIVSEDVVFVDDLVKYISFKPGFLYKIYV